VSATEERPADQPDPAKAVRLYTVVEAADILGVSERYVWELIREGVLHRVRFGLRTTRVRDDELAALVDQHTQRGLDA